MKPHIYRKGGVWRVRGPEAHSYIYMPVGDELVEVPLVRKHTEFADSSAHFTWVFGTCEVVRAAFVSFRPPGDGG